MNIILFDQKDYLDRVTIELTDRRFHHIRKIHRAKIGDRLRVGEENGLMGCGTIVAMNENLIRLQVELDEQPPDPLDVCLAVALPRPPTFQKVLQYCTSLGVKQFVFFHSKRVEKSYWKSHALRDESWLEHLRLGLEQAKDTVVPRVQFYRKHRDFIDSFLEDKVECGSIFVADPSIEAVDSRDRIAKGKKATVVLGPEAGLLSYEVDRILGMGANRINLGDRILRVEVAAAVAASLFRRP